MRPAVPDEDRQAAQPRRHRTARGHPRSRRRRALPVTAGQKAAPPRPPPQLRHVIAAGEGRRRRHCALARPRRHPIDRRLRPRRPQHQGACSRPDHPRLGQTRPLQATRPGPAATTPRSRRLPPRPPAGASPSLSSATSSMSWSTRGRPPGRSSTRATPTPRPGSPPRPPRFSKARLPPSRPESAAAPPPTATRPPSARVPTPARTTSPPKNRTWTTPAPSPKAGQSPPE